MTVAPAPLALPLLLMCVTAQVGGEVGFKAATAVAGVGTGSLLPSAQRAWDFHMAEVDVVCSNNCLRAQSAARFARLGAPRWPV